METVTKEELIAILHRLLFWHDVTGRWESVVWRNAESLRNRIEGKPESDSAFDE